MPSPTVDMMWQETRVLKARTCELEKDVQEILECCSNTGSDLTEIWNQIEIINNQIIDIYSKITSIENRLTTIEGDITDIKGDIIDIQGDITDIQGDITTIQGDITDIKGDIITINNRLADFVTLNTPQTILSTAPKIWDSVQQFNEKVGIGVAPTVAFDVASGTGKLRFDGIRLEVSDDAGDKNVFIGPGAGGTNPTMENVGIGASACRNPIGERNAVVGLGCLLSIHETLPVGSTVTVDRNAALGNRALTLSNGSDNTAVGFSAGAATYGANNIAIGSGAQNSYQIYTGTIPNSNAIANTNTYSGVQTASFITALTSFCAANGITISNNHPRLATYLHNVPILTAAPTYTNIFANLVIIDSQTVKFDTPAYITGATAGNLTVDVFQPSISNSIAIGYGVTNNLNHQIVIGNASHTEFRSRNLVVDLTAVPTAGQALLWDGATSRYKPQTVAVSSIASIGVTLDGGGSLLTTGQKGYLYVPYNATITGWTIISKESGTFTFDIWKKNNGKPTSSSESICNVGGGGIKPNISVAGQYANSVNVGGWGTGVNIAARDVIAWNLDAVTVSTWVTLQLTITKI